MLTGVTAAHPQLGNMASIVEQQPVSASEPVADEEQRASAQRPSASKFLPIAQTVFIEYASIGGRTPVQLEDHALDGAKVRSSALLDEWEGRRKVGRHNESTDESARRAVAGTEPGVSLGTSAAPLWGPVEAGDAGGASSVAY